MRPVCGVRGSRLMSVVWVVPPKLLTPGIKIENVSWGDFVWGEELCFFSWNNKNVPRCFFLLFESGLGLRHLFLLRRNQARSKA